MKNITLLLMALCFVWAGAGQTFGQTRKTAKKNVKPKLVKCYEKGKAVYRTKCRVKITSPTDQLIAVQTTKKQSDTSLSYENPYGVSNGSGQGAGTGGGFGTGRGVGNGVGDGIGLGNPDEIKKTTPTKSKKIVGPTVGLKLLSIPRAPYTDAARQNNVQGTVILRITFLAGGQIGGISVVKSLPNGLTEQAIAAARQIRFEPAKNKGVPYTVSKAVQFSFTIY